MTVTDQYYGAHSVGIGRTVQDFGLCDLTGTYLFTLKARQKGFLVVVFFGPESAPSLHALDQIAAWSAEVGPDKWSAVAVAGISSGDTDAVKAFQSAHPIAGLTIVLDHEWYQTRAWGVSHLPSTYLIDAKGRVIDRVLGDDPAHLTVLKDQLATGIARIKEAEAAAKKADDEKKAADAAKAAEAKPAEPKAEAKPAPLPAAAPPDSAGQAKQVAVAPGPGEVGSQKPESTPAASTKPNEKPATDAVPASEIVAAAIEAPPTVVKDPKPAADKKRKR